MPHSTQNNRGKPKICTNDHCAWLGMKESPCQLMRIKYCSRKIIALTKFLTLVL